MNNHFRHYASLLLGKGRKRNPEPDASLSPEEQATERLLKELVPLQEAAMLAYISAYGIDTTITRIQRNDMAESLSKLLSVYAVSDDRKSIRRVGAEDLQGGIFADGGKIVRFRDDREAITGLAVTREALKAAVAALKDTKKPSGFSRVG
jgi:hypothetical protein